ncbi:hypothetical protein RvY_17865-1 [Ramazzottius varieornatus]|uniref:enoyl-CoA hydratase n=1 Tax=Ramazzottius varieornatus TaxID=947166 RepID=A0A1D1W3P3_RAMVA|nr:hypothetical protein RvY_17865-2 [Ramazzottius varieornatus]GAV08126.1 hypothetical protein RvY_17865-1 [Ramazzottius varieornatus]
MSSHRVLHSLARLSGTYGCSEGFILRGATSGSRNLTTASKQATSPAEKIATEYQYENLLVEVKGAKRNVGFIQLHRPKKHNAISPALSKELRQALDIFEKDDAIGAIVYTGGERVFTVGADISVMEGFTFPGVFKTDFSLLWNKFHDCRKPIVAAVNGYCVGGGTETVMMCDIVYAGERAQFGQPEINIGTLPGAGGTQRLIRAIGKSKAMEMIFTGDRITARQAEGWGLISKVFPSDQVIPEAIKLAELIASRPRMAALMAKDAVKFAQEVPLRQGLRQEKYMSSAMAATNDFKEGTSAFLEKREPKFTD